MIRVVVDTNVLVRGALSPSGGSAFIVQAFKQRRFVLLTSPRHLQEIFRTLGYPRLRRKYRLSDRVRKRLVAQIAARGLMLSTIGSIALCRDPQDDFLIELALLGRADFVVTEDADLHEDATIVRFLMERGVRLIYAAEFAAVLRREAGE
jgi:putative PIN family toxin of toxin-antitoxin system